MTFKLNLKSNFTSVWACPHHNSLVVQVRIIKFGCTYGRLILVTAVHLPRRLLQSRLHSGLRMRATVLRLRWACHPIWDPSRIIATRCSHWSGNPLQPQNHIYVKSHLSCLYKLNFNLFSHHERHFFSSIVQQSAIFIVVIKELRNGPRYWRNDFSIPSAP